MASLGVGHPQQAMVKAELAAKLQGQTIEKRKSIDTNNHGHGNAHQRAPSRKLEPLVEGAKGKMIPK